MRISRVNFLQTVRSLRKGGQMVYIGRCAYPQIGAAPEGGRARETRPDRGEVRIEEDKFYEEGYQKIVESLNKKEKQLKKKNSKNALAIIYKNRLIAFIKKLLSFDN